MLLSSASADLPYIQYELSPETSVSGDFYMDRMEKSIAIFWFFIYSFSIYTGIVYLCEGREVMLKPGGLGRNIYENEWQNEGSKNDSFLCDG